MTNQLKAEKLKLCEGRERWLFACLLVAFMAGTIALKAWVFSIEQRLAENLVIHQLSADITQDEVDVLEIHERRLRSLEHASWSILDGQLESCGE